MAEETLPPVSEDPAATGTPSEVVVPLAEEKLPAAKEAPPPPPAPEAEEPEKPPPAAEEPTPEAAAAESLKKKRKGSGVPLSFFFKEESNVVADLEDAERTALAELKKLVQAALANHEFTRPPPPPPAAKEEEKKPAENVAEAAPTSGQAEETAAEASKAAEAAPAMEEQKENLEQKAAVVDEDGAKTVEAIEETVVPVASAAAAHPPPAADEKKAPTPPPSAGEVSIWGVPLVGGGERSDTVLLKFLRARDFKVEAAMAMLRSTVLWREDFGVEALLEEDLQLPELERAVFMEGHDREGHPVCYNVYGELREEGLYQKVFGDEEGRRRFLRWRVQLLERGIRQRLDFSATGVCSMVQVTDLKNSPGLGRKELRLATKQALELLQDNYPEFVAKQVFINVPWWYMAFHKMISPFLTHRTKSKFIFAGPSRSSETLFEYIAPEQVPVQFGGLSKKEDPDFTTSDPVTEFTIKPSTKHTVVVPAPEACVLVWELRVLGWDVSYGAEFVPSAEDGYSVIVDKDRRFSSTDEPFVKNSFKAGEPGEVVITVDNPTSRKKKLLYRCKTKKAADTI